MTERKKYPRLVKLAKKILLASFEKVFSTTGNIVNSVLLLFLYKDT